MGLDDVHGSGQKKDLFGQITGLGLGNEEGVLLQADFEFDEEGNLVELGSPKPGWKSSVGPLGGDGPDQGQGWDGDQVSSLVGVRRLGNDADSSFLDAT